MYNSYINAIAPFLVKEDIICYLDDDNWYDKEHVKYMAYYIDHYQTQYAYGLRYYVSHITNQVWEDNLDSLGFWCFSESPTTQCNFTLRDINYTLTLTMSRPSHHLIDVSCLALTKTLAQQLAKTWVQFGYGNDRYITKTLLDQNIKGACTGKRTLYYLTNENTYILSLKGLIKGGLDQTLVETLSNQELMNITHQVYASANNYLRQQECLTHNSTLTPWETPTIIEKGKLTPIT